MEINSKRDTRIRITILFEYYNRLYKKSENPEMHFYVIPELKDIDNEIIYTNAVYLIDENFVRGGVDIAGTHSFPWITRINSSGIELVEQLVVKSKEKIPELKDELEDESPSQNKVLSFISNYLKNKETQSVVIDLAKEICKF